MFWMKKLNTNQKILKQYIKGIDRIISKYGEDGHEVRVAEVKKTYREFESSLTGAELDQLDPDIMDLNISLNENLSGEALADLRQKAKELFEKHSKD